MKPIKLSNTQDVYTQICKYAGFDPRIKIRAKISDGVGIIVNQRVRTPLIVHGQEETK